MAVNPDWRNVHTSLETGKRAATKRCMRCGVGALTSRARLCGPCQADRYDERVKAARIKAKEYKAKGMTRAKERALKAQDVASAASIDSYLQLIGRKP